MRTLLIGANGQLGRELQQVFSDQNTIPLTHADLERQAKGNLLGRIPSLEDIADTAVYLARNRSVTGRTLIVDGGAIR